jgi:putative peptidoglycan lipid II flippase
MGNSQLYTSNQQFLEQEADIPADSSPGREASPRAVEGALKGGKSASDSQAPPPASTAFPGQQHKAGREVSVNVRILGIIASLAGITLAARALGVINQVAISDHFGAGAAMDAYFAALALPTFLGNLAVGALEASVIPIYARLHRVGQEREASEVLSTLFNIITLALGSLTALMLIFPEVAVRIFAPGVSPKTSEIAVALAPLLFPTLLLNTFVGFITSVLNTTGRFALPAFSAVLSPLCMLGTTIFLGDALGVSALAIGLLVGTVLQFLVMAIIVRKTHLRYRPTLLLKNRSVLLILAQLWPVLFSEAIANANPVIDQAVASLLGTGNISALNYALKIVSIPVSIIFAANSRAVLPFFSSQAAAADFKNLKETLRIFTWLIGLATLGASIVLVIFARPIVTLLFHHGAFTAQATQMTAFVLIGFSLGLSPMALGFLIPKVFCALRRNDILFKVSFYTLISNIALDVLLAHFLDLPGIALATSIDYLLTVMLQIAVLRLLIGPLGLLKPPPQLLHLLLWPLYKAGRLPQRKGHP